MCRAIQIMQEGKKKAEAENRQLKAENRQVRAELTAKAKKAESETRQVKAELKESNRENKLLIKMLKESGHSATEIKSYLSTALL